MMQLSTATILSSTKGSVFGPFEWLTSRQSSSSPGSGNETRNPCLVWKSGEQWAITDEIISNDLDQLKGIDLTGLLYFVTDLPDDQIQIAYSSDRVYKLTVNNNNIGFAVNVTSIFDGNTGGFTGVLLEDPDNGCFTLMVWLLDEVGSLQLDNKDKFILPMSSCLYDNVYRSFYNNGDCINNPYYGPIGSSDFDFAQLPDHIFHQILRQLPLAQRVHSRRVSLCWLTMANIALAVDTKIFDDSNSFHISMTPDQLKLYLPLVSDYLEVLKLGCSLLRTLDTLCSITTFPALKELCLCYCSISDGSALFYMLDRCPKLQVLETPIPTNFPMLDSLHGPYAVEKLTLIGRQAGDPQLVAFLDYFPSVSCLNIDGDFTPSCISLVMVKYASKLHQLELLSTEASRSIYNSSSPTAALTGIQTCSNLQHLSVFARSLVSDILMGALAAGCHKLETFSFECCRELTNGGLAALAVLPNLTQLRINGFFAGRPDLSVGVTAIARAGQLMELVTNGATLSAACLKTIVRHCRYLKRLEIMDNRGELTVEHATEIVRLYGIWGMEPRLIFRTGLAIWESEDVREVIEEINESHDRHFEVIRDH